MNLQPSSSEPEPEPPAIKTMVMMKALDNWNPDRTRSIRRGKECIHIKETRPELPQGCKYLRLHKDDRIWDNGLCTEDGWAFGILQNAHSWGPSGWYPFGLVKECDSDRRRKYLAQQHANQELTGYPIREKTLERRKRTITNCKFTRIHIC